MGHDDYDREMLTASDYTPTAEDLLEYEDYLDSLEEPSEDDYDSLESLLAA